MKQELFAAYFTGQVRLKYDIFRKAVGERLQRARRRAGYSISGVAKQTGLSLAFLRRIEGGQLDGRRKWCEVFHLYILGDLYGVTVSHLLGDDNRSMVDRTLSRKVAALPSSLQIHIQGLIEELHALAPLYKEVIVHVEPSDIRDK